MKSLSCSSTFYVVWPFHGSINQRYIEGYLKSIQKNMCIMVDFRKMFLSLLELSESTYYKCSNPDVSTEQELINIFEHKIYSFNKFVSNFPLPITFHDPIVRTYYE